MALVAWPGGYYVWSLGQVSCWPDWLTPGVSQPLYLLANLVAIGYSIWCMARIGVRR